MNMAAIDLTEKVKEQKKNIERKTLTISEAAQVLGVGENKMRQLSRSKGFPVIRVGARILIPTTKFEEWIENSIGMEF